MNPSSPSPTLSSTGSPNLSPSSFGPTFGPPSSFDGAFGSPPPNANPGPYPRYRPPPQTQVDQSTQTEYVYDFERSRRQGSPSPEVYPPQPLAQVLPSLPPPIRSIDVPVYRVQDGDQSPRARRFSHSPTSVSPRLRAQLRDAGLQQSINELHERHRGGELSRRLRYIERWEAPSSRRGQRYLDIGDRARRYRIPMHQADMEIELEERAMQIAARVVRLRAERQAGVSATWMANLQEREQAVSQREEEVEARSREVNQRQWALGIVERQIRER